MSFAEREQKQKISRKEKKIDSKDKPFAYKKWRPIEFCVYVENTQ